MKESTSLRTWLSVNWPGRTVVRTAESLNRVGLFDRSMTVAAQLFTSVFPFLILLATWATNNDASRIADAVNMPEQSRATLTDAVTAASDGSVGVISALIVLISATGVSRALTRAFAVIWVLPQPKVAVTSVWRWVTVVLALVLSLLAVRSLGRLLGDLPPGDVWPTLAYFVCDFAAALFVPWILLAGTVRMRLLVPGAAIGAAVFGVARPAASEWFTGALDTSADQYGSIGVAFTYLALLYAISLCFMGTAIIGQVVATDEGSFGQRIRGEASPDDEMTGDPAAVA